MSVKEVASAYIETDVSNEHLKEIMELIDKHYGLDEVNDEVVRLFISRRKNKV